MCPAHYPSDELLSRHPIQYIWRVILSLSLLRQIFKIIYGIIKNQQKMGQVAFIMHVA